MDPLQHIIGAGHLNAILERAGVSGGPPVRDVTVISDTPTMVSRIVRLRLTYAGPAGGLPRSLIVKTGRSEQSATGWPRRPQEVAFYRDVAPSLPAGIVPRCFAADDASATTPSCLVLEDLTETHALATDPPLPPSETQCRTIVASLARIHAAWWEDPRLGVSVGAWPDDAATDRLIQQMVRCIALFTDRLGDALTHAQHAFYARLIAASPRLPRPHRDAGNFTLAHGDAHMWNCFLPRDGSSDARWFDWDAWRIGNPAHDLAYMIAVHWYPERRRWLEAALLDHYHATLQANGVLGYSRAGLQADYRRAVLRHTVTPVFQAAMNIPPRIWWNNFQHIMAAVDDLGCGELLD